MNETNQGQYALLLIFISFLLVLGSLMTAFAETGLSGGAASPKVTNYIFSTSTPNATLTPTEYQTAPTSTVQPVTQEANLKNASSPSILAQCEPPAGWEVYLIQNGDTTETVAEQFQTNGDALVEGNCLQNNTLLPGYIIFLPTTSSSHEAADAASCSSPAGWIRYTVKKGDNLFQISRAFGISIEELKTANCMGSSSTIISGTEISVPAAATKTPTKT